MDQSAAYASYARSRVFDPRAGDAGALPFRAGAFDALVSGLVLNFVTDPAAAVIGMTRVARPGGMVGDYVWNYADGMELIWRFWDAAVSIGPAARGLDEGERFGAICRPDVSAVLFSSAGLNQIDARAVDVPTRFRDFDDFWTPFLGGQGPAPGYAIALNEERRAALR